MSLLSSSPSTLRDSCSNRGSRAFTALESLVMLVILTVLTMIAIGILKKMVRSESLAPDPPSIESVNPEFPEDNQSPSRETGTTGEEEMPQEA